MHPFFLPLSGAVMCEGDDKVCQPADRHGVPDDLDAPERCAEPRQQHANGQIDEVCDREHFHVARAAQDAVYSHFEADEAEEKADELQIVLAGRHGLGRGGGIEEHGDDRRAEQLQKDAQQHGDQHDHPIGRAVALRHALRLLRTDVLRRVGAPFFMIFFGLCLGDSGYGLFLFVGATAYRLLAKKLSQSAKSIISLIQILATSTFFCGLLTGTFFGANIYDLPWPFIQRLKSAVFMDNNDMFQLSLILGAVQILFGMVLKAVNQTIQFGFKYAIATIGWIILLLSLAFSALLPKVMPMGSTRSACPSRPRRSRPPASR